MAKKSKATKTANSYAEAMIFVDPMFVRVRQMMIRTWGAIAYDIAEIENCDPDDIHKDIKYEMVLDADRMLMYGRDKEAYEWWETVTKNLDYEVLLKLAARCL